jgi:hypothetical protein
MPKTCLFNFENKHNCACRRHFWLGSPSRPRPPHRCVFDITLRHITFGRTSLDEGSARRRDLYLTTRNTHNRQTSMLPAGFEPAIPASERPQTHTIDRATTGIGLSTPLDIVKNLSFFLQLTSTTFPFNGS